MTHPRRGLAAAALLLLGALVAPAVAAADTPRPGALYEDGASGRHLLGGRWLFRADPEDTGVRRELPRSTRTAGWRPVTVPHAWNAGIDTDDSLIGAPAWYRRDFRLPRSPATTWKVRFEAVNHRASVWLNGRLVGTNTGGYLPFELELKGLERRRVNRLVVRVDNRRLPTDLPSATFTDDELERPRGGWWNYGGIAREVYLRPVDRVDLTDVRVTPRLGCPGCDAAVDYRVTVRNETATRQRVRIAGRLGELPVRFRAATVAPGRERELRASVRVPSPRLWSPRDPHLYRSALVAEAASGGRYTRAAGWSVHVGIRSLAVSPDGRLLLNGRPTSFRGVGIHEDHPVRGNALTNADREQIVAWTRQLGGTAIRSHYPLHPHLYELGDRLGILMWSEVPVYQMPGEYLGRPEVRGAGVDMVRRNVLANGNHASVFTWSVANELADVPAQPETDYLAAAAAAAKELDRSRPVSYALAGHPLAGCPAAYAPFDLLGLNDYFGWGGGQVARREDIRPYLDQMRGCYPSKALVVTETGAEANRSGPAGEKGTYEFQREYARHHLREYAATPYLSGAMWWTLQDFRIRPNWTGGNPRPTPPMHQKALIHFDGTPKPAFEDVREGFGAVEQYP